MKRLLLAAVALSLLPTSAAASTWQMNEGRHASVMHDSSSWHLNGHIGSRVQPGGGFYRFPGGVGYNPGNIVRVPDNPRLDPRSGRYVVTIKFRTRARRLGREAPNFVQKGQANHRGGYWKLAQNRGWPRCHFTDASGTTSAVGFVLGKKRYKVNDGHWHKVRCARTRVGSKITLWLGHGRKVTKVRHKRTGWINNTYPLTVGGKWTCGPRVTCDYLPGSVAWLSVKH